MSIVRIEIDGKFIAAGEADTTHEAFVRLVSVLAQGLVDSTEEVRQLNRVTHRMANEIAKAKRIKSRRMNEESNALREELDAHRALFAQRRRDIVMFRDQNERLKSEYVRAKGHRARLKETLLSVLRERCSDESRRVARSVLKEINAEKKLASFEEE